MNESCGLKGFFKIDHYDKAGNLIESVGTPNVITVDGMNEVAELIGTDVTSTATAFDYIAVGTGTTAAVKTDTALETEVTDGQGLNRAAGTGTVVTTTDTGDTFQLVKSFSPTSSYAVTESGVLNASSLTTSELLCHQTFSAINVTDGDTLTITWKIAVA